MKSAPLFLGPLPQPDLIYGKRRLEGAVLPRRITRRIFVVRDPLFVRIRGDHVGTRVSRCGTLKRLFNIRRVYTFALVRDGRQGEAGLTLVQEIHVFSSSRTLPRIERDGEMKRLTEPHDNLRTYTVSRIVRIFFRVRVLLRTN